MNIISLVTSEQPKRDAVTVGGELCVVIQGPDGKGETMRATRLPVTIDPELGRRYALVSQVIMGVPHYMLIAQVPGAPQWRVVNGNLDSVARIGIELFDRNGIPLAPLFGWGHIERKIQAAYERMARRQ